VGVGVVVAPLRATTAMLNVGRLALLRPSLTEMRMFAYVPSWLYAGVPESVPVRQSKLAHAGLLRIKKKRRAPRPPATDGVTL
jgi:hypothetical protein